MLSRVHIHFPNIYGTLRGDYTQMILEFVLFLYSFVLLNKGDIKHKQDKFIYIIMNILVIIIAGGSYPQYAEMESIWRKYMHLFKPCFNSYFIFLNPQLQNELEVIDDVIWVKGEETVTPGMLLKTITSMKYALDGKFGNFDYVVRSNLSSVINLPLLYELLDKWNQNGQQVDYLGSQIEGWIEGSGMVFSRRACQYLCDNININTSAFEDVAIGHTLNATYPITHYPKRDILCLKDLQGINEYVIQYYFHYRCKSHDHQHTCTIMNELVERIFT